MPFMKPQAVNQTMLHVETYNGTEYVPAELVGENPSAEDLQDYVHGEILLTDEGTPDMVREEGFYARFSANGFMDCTDWCGPRPSEEEALAYLAETHDVCPRCFEACWDTDETCSEEGEE